MSTSLLSSCFPRVRSGPSATSLLFGRSMWRNPLSLVVALLSLLLFSRSCTNVFQDSSSFSLFLPASAAPVSPKVFSEPVQLATACDVCNRMMVNLVLQVARGLERQNKTVATPRDMDVFMEHLCDPSNVGGAWLRRLGYFVVPDDTENPTSPVHFELRLLKDYAKCKRGCVTAQEICQSLLEMPMFDIVPKRLAAITQESGPFMNESVVYYLRENVCQRFAVCDERKKYIGELNQILNSHNRSLRLDLEKDIIEWATEDDLKEKLMVYDAQRKHKLDSIERDDILALQKAVERNDQEAAAAIDKAIGLLSRSEFQELRNRALSSLQEGEERLM